MFIIYLLMFYNMYVSGDSYYKCFTSLTNINSLTNAVR
jgi:hypothetical protein